MGFNNLNLPKEQFDLYGRYATLGDIINVLRTKPTYKILEVGGFGSLLPQFLPNDQITLSDILPSNKPNYIRADGCNLPFQNQSFDIVVSTDVLEHIEPSGRLKFLNESKRVACDLIIVAAPFFNSAIIRFEKDANEYYRLLSGQNHPWLKEHLEFGLPETRLAEQFFSKNQLIFTKTYHANLTLWPALNRLLFFISANYSKLIKKAFEEFNLYYNQEIYPLDHQENSYRTIYVAKLNPVIDLKNVGFQTGKITLEQRELILKKIFDIITLSNKKVIKDKERHIQNLEKITSEARKSEKEKIAETGNLKIKLNWAKNQIVRYGKTSNNLKQRLSLAKLSQQLSQQHISNLEKELENIKSGRLWRILQRFNFFIGFISQLNKATKHTIQYQGLLLRSAYPSIRRGNFLALFRQTKNYLLWLRNPAPVADVAPFNRQYELFLKKQVDAQSETKKKNECKKWSYKPKVSIIMPVYNTEEAWLVKAIESVRSQIYPYWELIIIDDRSTKKTIRAILSRYSVRDDRIKTKYFQKNTGIAHTSNQGIKMSTGEFIGLLDHDDELTNDALYEIVRILNGNKDLDMFYSDEDKIDPSGRLVSPFFKPGWSPDMLLSTMYTSHFGVYRSTIVKKIGGFRKGFESSQDYDLVLRFTEMTNKIYHIPKVLYHWRMTPGSTAVDYYKKNTTTTSLKALSSALKRRRIDGTVEEGLWPGFYRVKYRIQNQSLVSIIIPTKGKHDLLSRCLESIHEKTTYPHYEIIIVDNNSSDIDTLSYLQSIKNRPNLRILSYPHKFNFSAINNFAASKARGDIFIFLNNDTEIISPDWIESMLEHAQRQEIGAVGAKLLYPNNTIQHAGVILGIGGVANHAFYKLSESDPGYFGLHLLIRNYSALTAACLMIRKEIFKMINGFDKKFVVVFNDVDLCLRLRKKGLYLVYTPYAKLYHHESSSLGKASGGRKVDPREIDLIQKRWVRNLINDPFYNPNLTLDKEDFSLRI